MTTYANAVFYELMNPVQQEPEQIDFHLHYALRTRNVLDYGAATGRMAIPLAERRIHVTAYDKFPGMLAGLLLKLAGRPELHPYLTPIWGDSNEVDLKRQFPHAYMARVLFYMVDDAERVAAFRWIHKHLEPNGIFVVDAPIGPRPSQPIAPFHKTRLGRAQYSVDMGFQRQGGTRYKLQCVYNEFYDGKLIHTDTSEVDAADIPSKAYMVDLFKESGFELDEAYVDHKFKPYPTTGDANYGIFVARKR